MKLDYSMKGDTEHRKHDKRSECYSDFDIGVTPIHCNQLKLYSYLNTLLQYSTSFILLLSEHKAKCSFACEGVLTVIFSAFHTYFLL